MAEIAKASGTRDQRGLIDAAWRQFEEHRSTIMGLSKGGQPPQRKGPRLAGPDAIPGYDIEYEIHRGGQGVVYSAVQKSTQRRVAIKVMREGPFAGPRERVRFEREVQILAQLKHPNIVTIHDSGVSDTSAYFVMDYIEGQPLDRHLERTDLSMRERLELFAKICAAVNAAHLRGVIHRDLKPGNIRIDHAGEPHILDFGLAKQAADGDEVSLTLTGQFVGSLPWASPEQAEGRMDDVDLRTDVYALGVMLYQLLTARFPYKISGSLRETTHNIVHSEPASPREFNRELDDDPARIALKCLDKQRDGRYQTAGELERDLRRYLRGEPIEAKRDSLAYVLRKQIVRHRFAAAVGLAFTAVVLAALITSLAFWRQAVAAARAEKDQKIEAIQQRQAALDSEALARRQADRAEATAKFLEQILTSASPFLGGGRDATVVQALARAEQRLDDGELRERGDLEAEIRRVLGKTYAGLGMFEPAELHLRQARELMRSLHAPHDAVLLGLQAELAELLRANEKANEAETLLQETLAAARASDQIETVAACVSSLGGILRDRGDLASAEPLLLEALDLVTRLHPPPSSECAEATNNLALLRDHQNRPDEAEQMMSEVIGQYEQVHGRRDSRTATALANLASFKLQRGRAGEAEALFRESLAILSEVHGPDHVEVGSLHSSLGVLLARTGRRDEAAGELSEALRIMEKTHGVGHPATAGTLSSLGTLRYGQGRTAESAELLERAVAALEKAGQGDTPVMLTLLNNVAAIRLTRGEFQLAVELLERAYDGRVAIHGAEHPETLAVAANYAQALQTVDEHDQAEVLLRHLVDARRAAGAPELPATLALLGQVCCELGKFDEARLHYEESLALFGPGIDPSNQAGIWAGLARVAYDSGDLEAAAQLYCDATRLAEQTHPPGFFNTEMYRAMWGEVLGKLGRRDEAEQQIQQALDRLSASMGADNPRVAQIRARLDALFAAPPAGE